MSASVFPTGLADAVETWTTGTFQWMLVSSAYTPDPMFEVMVGDNAQFFEFTDGSYSRQTVTTPAVAIDLATDPSGVGGFVRYTADDPDFGVISGGEVAAWLVLYELVTNDADSPVIASLPTFYEADGVAAAEFTLPNSTAFRLAVFCGEATI